MYTPVNRLKEYYAAKEAQSTKDYVAYLVRSSFLDGGPMIHTKPNGNLVMFILTGGFEGQHWVVRFSVPFDASTLLMVTKVREATAEFKRMCPLAK